MPEIRQPNKGTGVPKETRDRNSILDLEVALRAGYPDADWDHLPDRLDANGFFDAGMQQQVRIMAEAAVGMLPADQEICRMITTLAASKEEKIRGVSAFAVPVICPGDWKAQIRELHFTGALEGTWPRELSATILHNLIIENGVASIMSEVREWTFDPDSAVRRLVTESFRPRGVMLAHIAELKQDPSPLHGLLQPLLDDESDYVRKAVANLSQDSAQVILFLNMDEPGKGKNRRQSRYHLWRGTIATDAVKHVSKTIHFVEKSRQPKEEGVYRMMVSVNGRLIKERSFVFNR